jgi:hypothetical protein
MATRAQIRELLDEGHSYVTAARKLRIAPGEAYLVATGRPADGSDGRWFDGRTAQPVSPQTLVGPPPVNPTRNSEVDAWVRERAARELTR